MTETIDLKVNRLLIDPKFETYYLTNQEVSLKSIPLNNPVSELTLEDKQLYSYLHFVALVKDFNHLITDPFEEQSSGCYYIDSGFQIFYVRVEHNQHSINQPVCVFNIPNGGEKPADCLTTLSFPCKDIALILFSRCSPTSSKSEPFKCNSTLLVISTGDRSEHDKNWTLVDSFDLNGETSTSYCWQRDDEKAKQLTSPGKLMDSYYHSLKDKDVLETVILTVSKNNEEKFECLLSCLQLCKTKQATDTQNLSKWSMNRLQQLTGSSYPSYIGVDVNSRAELMLTIASESPFGVSFDSCRDPDMSLNFDQQTSDLDEQKGNTYAYYQNDSEITVNFKLPKDTDSTHIHVNFKVKELEIHVRGERVFKETLWAEIDIDGCTWTLDKNSKDCVKDDFSILQITVTKKDDQTWNQLIAGNEFGSAITSEEESAVLQDLSLLAAGLTNFNRIKATPRYIPSLIFNEQCDEVSEDLILYRLNCNQNSVTHQAFLGGHQWLFYRSIDATNLPCFALRHDIDALIWQPKASDPRFHVEHLATFSALGYVQASKETKKFLNCSPDFEYAFIADSANHVYIYKQPELCEGVTDRKEGKRPKIAKQKVINLGSEPVQVLGSAALKQFLLILGTKTFFSIKVDF